MILLTALPKLVLQDDFEDPCVRSGLLKQPRLNDGRRRRSELLLARPSASVTTLMPVLAAKVQCSVLQLLPVPLPQPSPP